MRADSRLYGPAALILLLCAFATGAPANPAPPSASSSVSATAEGKEERVAPPSAGPAAPCAGYTQYPIISTKCPQKDTKCPAADTECPKQITQCPVTETQCPFVTTECPRTATLCPEAETKCPRAPTACPAAPTKCPVAETKCPGGQTRCPAVETKCPAAETQCPPSATKCPEAETKCPVEAGKCGPDVSLTFLVKDAEGNAATGATVSAWLPGIRSAGVTTDEKGSATLARLRPSTTVRAYVLSADRTQAAEVVVAGGVAKGSATTEVRLRPARPATVSLEDQAGNRLAGTIRVYIVCPEALARTALVEEEKDCHLVIQVEATGTDKPASVEGLIPGVRYLVKGLVEGYVSAHADPWVEWTFAEADGNPKLVIRFERKK